jgi:hypothetical protein
MAQTFSDIHTDIGRLYYGRHRLTFRIGTYLALVRMMGIAHLVTSLYGHALLVSETHARLARTRKTLRDLICCGFDSAEGRAAVQRLCEVHRPLKADPDDFRYVLATFFLEPIRWNEQHARTRLTPEEEALLLEFWERVGRSMGMADMPASLPQWKQFQRDYEARRMAYTAEGHRLAGMCLRDVVKLTLPFGTRWMFRQMMVATLEPAVRDKLGIAALRWHERGAGKALVMAFDRP